MKKVIDYVVFRDQFESNDLNSINSIKIASFMIQFGLNIQMGSQAGAQL